MLGKRVHLRIRPFFEDTTRQRRVDDHHSGVARFSKSIAPSALADFGRPSLGLTAQAQISSALRVSPILHHSTTLLFGRSPAHRSCLRRIYFALPIKGYSQRSPHRREMALHFGHAIVVLFSTPDDDTGGEDINERECC
jgi:hypothetical protein